MDPRRIEVKFSPPMQRAFADLEAAVHFDEQFDAGILGIIQNWAAGKKVTVHDFAISLPLIAEETFNYIHATQDERARAAWSEICNQMPEKGFTVEITQNRAR